MSAVPNQPRHVASSERIAELEATLKDIVVGADIMLEPALNLTGSFLGYVREVKRVAEAVLK